MTHTKGPWEQSDIWICAGKINREITKGRKKICVMSFERNFTNPERNSNAHLIAAAPDLLEALETIENDDGKIPGWLWDRITKAVARAKGAVV